MKKYLLPMLTIGILIVGAISIQLLLRPKKDLSKPPQMSLMADVYYLTQPVTTVFGRIETVDGSTIRVVQRFHAAQPEASTKDLSFSFTVDSSTTIVKLATFVPYLFKTTTTPSDQPVAVGNLQIGDVVTVKTPDDLRLESAIAHHADRVEIVTVSNALSGTIVGSKAGRLMVRAKPPAIPISLPVVASAKDEQEYAVALTADTEVSKRSGSLPIAISADALLPGTSVTVYTKEDVAWTKSVTAMRIEPKP